DNVAAVQDVAMRALYAAASGQVSLIVQISARAGLNGAGTAFFDTKRTADYALAASGVPFVIFRPAIVIGRDAHGGSALLRALAAIPLFTPLVHPASPLQFVALSDVSEAVARAIDGSIPAGSDLDLAAPEIRSLAQAVARHRAWLGLAPVPTIAVPAWMAGLVARGADGLGQLGWRSPLRSTAMIVAAGGVVADPGEPPFPLRSLDETLAASPAGAQDLWFARLYLLKPVIFGGLSVFWLLSGLIALLSLDRSIDYLAPTGLPRPSAAGLAILTSLADIALGLAVAVRRFAAPALTGMILLSLFYLAGATLYQPALWSDPLGPLVKVLPSIALALVAHSILDER
ncbi:MAG: SDR family oxidoreductase, partial [Mesorhizobium sp.]|nr:SDR family oxidoreductase [Mesorhizobium sp.]